MSVDAIEYVAGLSASGLLIEIEVYRYGALKSYVQIDRSKWPEIVKQVEASMLAQCVDAQVETILSGDDDD